MNGNIIVERSSEQYGFTYQHFSGKGGDTAAHIDKDLFSIVMLKSGELGYNVEGKRIDMTPGDILIVDNNELHRSILSKYKNCEYLLLMLKLDFFIKNGCTEFSEMVFKRNMGENNIIPSKTVNKSGIFDIFIKIDRYCKEENAPSGVIRAIIIELLYNLNKHVIKSQNANYKPSKINDILAYINDNFTEQISLDDIANRFFLTKQYLCKIFKKNTGITINKYIAYKRIALVREIYSSGTTLSEACYKAGFKDYSCFYRAYSKFTDKSPSSGLNNKTQ
ncbi:MAG: helix-turn-helix transcriptional regulator [Clostridia bacterium]|nr:helix-turn-helix transcriptional regulator [Clostridia bacterium]